MSQSVKKTRMEEPEANVQNPKKSRKEPTSYTPFDPSKAPSSIGSQDIVQNTHFNPLAAPAYGTRGKQGTKRGRIQIGGAKLDN